MKTCPQCDTGYPDNFSTCPMHGHLLSEIRDLKPGMIIHQCYRIIRKLGQGGMGAVYLTHQILMDEPRALKFLSSELSHDKAFTSRFRREVRTLRQVRHKNVIDCGDLEPAEDSSLFFPMEFVDGPDLRQFLYDAPKPFDVSLALNITRQIAEGLGKAHAKGMVHRDIKPENILMAHKGDAWIPKITDFGIVATKESRTDNTRTCGTLLTMRYAAPEQWRGTPAAELDGRTDLYALGGILYEMLTGRTAFQADNYEGWAEQHRYVSPQPPSFLRPDLVQWKGLDAFVLSLLAKECNDRPIDVDDLLILINDIKMAPKLIIPPSFTEPGVIERLRAAGSKPVREVFSAASKSWVPGGRVTDSLINGRALTPAELAAAGIPIEDWGLCGTSGGNESKQAERLRKKKHVNQTEESERIYPKLTEEQQEQSIQEFLKLRDLELQHEALKKAENERLNKQFDERAAEQMKRLGPVGPEFHVNLAPEDNVVLQAANKVFHEQARRKVN